MNSIPTLEDDLAVYEDEMDARYSLTVFAMLGGVSSQTVIDYTRKGYLRSLPGGDQPGAAFDSEGLRQLRRIEHVRATCAVNDRGLRLILTLLHEVEGLRRDQRKQR